MKFLKGSILWLVGSVIAELRAASHPLGPLMSEQGEVQNTNDDTIHSWFVTCCQGDILSRDWNSLGNTPAQLACLGCGRRPYCIRFVTSISLCAHMYHQRASRQLSPVYPRRTSLAQQKPLHLYYRIVWWSFLACTTLFLRAFFGLGSFDDLALADSLRDKAGYPPLPGQTQRASSYIYSASSSSRRGWDRMSTQDLVDGSAVRFVAEASTNATTVDYEVADSPDTRMDDDSNLTPLSTIHPALHGFDLDEDPEENDSLSVSSSATVEESPFVTRFTTGDVDYTIDITSSRSRRDSDADSGSQHEPFISFEEYDGDNINFSFKIWLDSNEAATATTTLGEDEICEGSRGIKCLQDNQE